MDGGTLVEMLDDAAARHGDAPALVSGDEQVSYADLRDNAARVASGLARLGVGPGDRVALWLPNCVEYVEACFALARLGAIAVAVNTRYRAHEVADILGRSGARVLVVWPGFKSIDFLAILDEIDPSALSSLETLVMVGGRVGGDGSGSPTPELLARSAVVPFPALREAAPMTASRCAGDTACAVFTSSGTTSLPKLVLHRQAALATHASDVARTFGYRRPESVVLCMLPLCGVFGYDTLLAALAGGATAVLMPVFDAELAVGLIDRHRVTHTNGADEMLRRILAVAAPERIESLQEAGFASFSGDARALVDAGDDAGKHFFQTYGSSEVQALLCYQPPGTDPARRALGGGVPVSEKVEVRVREPETGRLLGAGEAGELEIRGPSVLAGYLGDAAARERTLTEDGFVRTGDLGRVEDDRSRFVYLARMGDALRLGGFLVNPREIEEFLEQQPGVDGAQVVGVNTDAGTAAVAFVVGPTAGDVAGAGAGAGTEPEDAARDARWEADLVARCRAKLAAFKVPRRIVRLDAFPTTASANGVKIRRVELRRRAAHLLGDGTARGG